MGEVRGKGVSFTGLLRALERRLGPEVLEAILASMTGEAGELARQQGFLSASWYPVSYYRELHAAIARVTGGGVVQARELGRSAALDDFQGVYRVFVRALSPTMLLNVAPRLVRRYWEDTRIDIHEVRRGFGHATLHGFHGFDERVWADVLGGVEALIIVCGGEAVRSDLRSGGGDAAYAEVKLHWVSP